MSLRKNSGCQQDEFIGKGVLFSFVMASTFWKMDDSKRNLLFEQLRNGQILTKSPYSRNDFRSYTIYQSQGGQQFTDFTPRFRKIYSLKLRKYKMKY